MQRLEVSGAVRLIYKSLGVKRLIDIVVFDYIPFPGFTHTTGMTHFQKEWKVCPHFSTRRHCELWGLRPNGTLRTVKRQFRADVSWQPSGPISKRQGIQKEILHSWILVMVPIGCHETSARNYRFTVRKFPQQPGYLSRRSEGPKSRTVDSVLSVNY